MRTSQNKEKALSKSQISTDIVSLNKKEILSRHSLFVSADEKGLKVHSDKRFLLFSEKDFSKFLNQPVELFLSQYELPFYGVIKSIRLVKKDLFEIHVDFMESAPLFYRECVADLLN